MIVRGLKLLLLAVACVAVVAGAASRLRSLYAAAGLAAERIEGPSEDEALFYELLEAKLLIPRPDGGLERVPRDWPLREAVLARHSGAANDAEDPLDDQTMREAESKRRLLGLLDRSAVGAIVEQQVELWNQTRSLTAIRDDRARDEKGGTQPWSAYGPSGRPLPSGQLVPETFGFVLDGELRAGYSDWLSIPGDHGEVTFHSEAIPGESNTLTLQLIGTPVRLPEGATSKKLLGEPLEGCLEQPVAHQIRVPIRTSTGGSTPIEITALASMHCAARIHGLAIRLEIDDAVVRYRFRPVGRSRPVGRYVIRAFDGEPLTDPVGRGRPSLLTEQLGMLPLIGTGAGDSFSLTGMLASTVLPQNPLDVRLTIDAEIQRAAHEALAWGVERFREDRWASDRKAALLVMDADSGAILAVAGQPAIPSGLADWDLPAFSAAYPLRDPSSIFAWEVIDKHNTPGSTFKPVTALALLMEAEPEIRKQIDPVLRGLDSGAMRAAIGLSYDSNSFIAYRGAKPVPNFGGSTLGRYVNRPKRDARCIADDPDAAERARQPEPGFGLRQATQFSLNAWYAAVALMMEQARIDEYAGRVAKQSGPRIPAPEMMLTRASRWIGIDDRERLDLAINLPVSTGLKRYSGEAHDVLFAQLARSTLATMAYNQHDWGARELVMYTTALNGIGQTISASPLQMALAAAAIATGQRVRPHLFASWNGVSLPPPDSIALPVDTELLELLRTGMKAVPEVGTAPAAFPRPLACHVYGKTGTAEIDAARAYNSGWFIGWREPARADQRRLAFACMTTHATGSYRFGGTACAPVVSRMLQRLETQTGDAG